MGPLFSCWYTICYLGCLSYTRYFGNEERNWVAPTHGTEPELQILKSKSATFALWLLGEMKVCTSLRRAYKDEGGWGRPPRLNALKAAEPSDPSPDCVKERR